MRFLLQQPYKLLWWTIPFILIIGLIRIHESIDFQVHDHYFVMAVMHLHIVVASILGILGFFYWLVRDKILIGWMTIVHIVVTMVAVFYILAITLIPVSPLLQFIANAMITMLALAALLAQLIFVVNLVISSMRDEPKNS